MGIFLIVLYVFAMLALGFWAMKKTKNVGDFFLGGRAVGPWLSAFAYGTTYFSAVLFIGYGGKLGWGFGLHTMWIVLGNVLIGSLLAWWVLGKRTREMTARLKAMTMPEFLCERYGSNTLKVAAALLIFVFLVPYSASVYMGLSYLFEQGLGIQYEHAVIFLAALTAVYLVMGGYFAVTLTDFLMGLMMIFGVGTMLVLLTGKAGGLGNAFQLLTNWELCSPGLKPAPPGAVPGWMTLASLVILTSFGPWGLPQMVQKFYSIKSSAQIKRAMIVASLFALVVTFGGYFTGAMTHLNVADGKAAVSAQSATADAYTSGKELPVKTGPDGKPKILPNGKPDVDWDRWIPMYLMKNLPKWVVTVIVLLVFSASMSTLSSLVLVSSSAVAIDLYGGVVNPSVQKKTLLTVMRVLCVVFVLLSLLIALKKPSLILNLMAISWGVLAGSFAAAYIYGLFWRRANAYGAGAGVLAGTAIAVALYVLKGEPFIPVAAALAILAPFIVVPIVSLITPPMSKELVNRAFTESPAQD